MSKEAPESGPRTAAPVSSYRDLIAWRKAMDLVRLTYQLSSNLPVEERFGLKAEMRRSAISIPSNIAEGWGRDSTRDYLRFLHIARGSTFELCTQAEACVQLAYRGEWSALITGAEDVGRLLNGLITSLRERVARLS